MGKDRQADPKRLGNAIQSTSMKGLTPESWTEKVWKAATGKSSK